MTIFIDSSILIEFIKGNKTELFEELIHSDHILAYNCIVFSEFIFHFLAMAGNKSPLTLKENKKIPELLDTNNPMDFLLSLQDINIDRTTNLLSYEFMKSYNLLPNDALILASIKRNEIRYLATFDNHDFKLPCEKENINLIYTLEDLKNIPTK